MANETLFSSYYFLLKVVLANLKLAEFICLIININFLTIWKFWISHYFFVEKMSKFYQTFQESQFLPDVFVWMVSLMKGTEKTQTHKKYQHVQNLRNTSFVFRKVTGINRKDVLITLGKHAHEKYGFLRAVIFGHY